MELYLKNIYIYIYIYIYILKYNSIKKKKRFAMIHLDLWIKDPRGERKRDDTAYDPFTVRLFYL